MSEVIAMRNLEFTYPEASRPTLKINQFNVTSGEKVFLFGPSGSGKTTLLEILAGVMIPNKGEVIVYGQNLSALSEAGRDEFRSRNLGYIFQSFNLLPYLNVRENILLPVQMRSGLNVSGQEFFDHLIDKLSLTSILHQSAAKISVGQAQRVAVARALLTRPKVILADEPTSSLDYERREKFLELLFSLCREVNSALVFVSHDLSLKDLFDRSVLLPSINSAETVEVLL